MRPLWLTETWPPDRGGMAESCDRIVRTLRARGTPVDLVHLSRRHPWLQVAERSGGLELRAPIGFDAAHDLNVLWAWLDTRRARWTHVVAFGGELPLLAGPSFAAWLGVPLITLLRGNDFDAAVFTPRRRPVLEAALRASAASAAVASGMAERASSLFGVDVRWIPNGIDLELWQATDGDRARAAALRADDDRVVIGLIGHLKAKKGAVLFLEALRRSGLMDRVRLRICGPVEPEVDAWLEQRGDGLVASIESERDRLELLPVYLSCDLVAIPSFYDGLPNACLEALALGVPVLCSRAGGLADVVSDGSCGWTFAPGDVEGCRDALARAVEDADRARLGAAGSVLVRERFTHAREAAAYEALLGGT